MKHTPVLSPLTLDAVQAEATGAHAKHGAHSVLSPYVSNFERLAILVEEVGEVSHLLTYDQLTRTRDELVKELLQVASVALTWVEALEGS